MECEGKQYIATVVCYFTKYVEAKAIPEKTGEQVAWFIYELISRYGCFEIALSDQSVYSFLYIYTWITLNEIQKKEYEKIVKCTFLLYCRYRIQQCSGG